MGARFGVSNRPSEGLSVSALRASCDDESADTGAVAAGVVLSCDVFVRDSLAAEFVVSRCMRVLASSAASVSTAVCVVGAEELGARGESIL